MKLLLNSDLFEYDIRGILLAFFPGQKFVTEETAADFGCLKIEYTGEEPSLTAKIRFEENGRTYEKSVFLNLEERKDAKSELKKALYGMLSEAEGKTLPWGTLTGIRPTKIPMKLLQEDKTDDEIIAYMRETYLCSEEKALLALEIAKRELKLIRIAEEENGYSLYIGIPFCPSICLYCSFSSFPVEKYGNRMDRYLDALVHEIEAVSGMLARKKPVSVYFGGGTPTSLSASQLDRLLKKVTECFDLSGVREWTVEAGRPDSVTPEKLDVLKKYPVTRISVNPQTMHQKTLDLIGRKHTVEDVVRVYRMAREKGFDNINMDLILGLPGETEADVLETMDALKELKPDSITIHSLALKRSSRLNLLREQYKDYAMDNSDSLMDKCREKCAEIGLKPYYLYRQKNMAGNQENVGYALPGKEGLYNILIMEEVQTIAALGAGSVTKRVFSNGRIERADNVKNVDVYIEKIDEMIGRKEALFGMDENVSGTPGTLTGIV